MERRCSVLPSVSVLTPSFNQAQWLADNLRSVRNQTYSGIEHIVMDGGSTDDSLKILQSSDGHVVWRSEADRGQSHALNKAFAKSKGDIIGWLNSDDAYVDRRAVETAVDAFNRNPEVGVVYGHGLLVNQSNRVLQYLWTPNFDRSAFLRGTYFVQPSVFIRRSLITFPLVEESLNYVMDRDLWMRLLNRTTFRRINVVVGLDRYQPDRKTLQQDFPREYEEYERNRGNTTKSLKRSIGLKGQKIVYRLCGFPGAMRLPKQVDPSIELDFGSLRSRVLYQGFVPRRRMPLG
jgi:glycosyltransferase involved in cell wall biosynthesis